MPSHEGRAVFLPYCLQRRPDGRYVCLNRDYKPIGFKTRDHIDYDAFPIGVKMPGLTQKIAQKLSHSGSDDLSVVFLYNDATVPTHSAKNMAAYLGRLEILAKLKVE